MCDSITDRASSSEAPSDDLAKWQAEKAFREREVAVKEKELTIKEAENAASKWRNPLVVAIFAAAVAAAGNAVVALTNGIFQRQLETQTSEHSRILEMIKTGDPDKAATNLKFLLDAGLVADPDNYRKLKAFLDTRKAGSGPTLPAPESQRIVGQVVTSHAGDSPEDGPDATSCVSADVANGWHIVPGSGHIVTDSIVNGTLSVTVQDETPDHYCGTFHITRADRGHSAGASAHADAVERSSTGSNRSLGSSSQQETSTLPYLK
ncbi:hypothetical protein AWB74_08722 [Caballeronia arvi]|uniref:Uncharacterized protein n=2 Tax=Caballeronia arvi TaxID=1777135 RepID=A0A158L6V0_9BURK|nr:hypothetical protein AWB74_08722 [Caballeronia arvi]